MANSERRDIIIKLNTELIEKYIQENDLSKIKFCKICKISYSTFNRLMTNGRVMVDALLKVAKVLDIEVYQLVK